MRDDDRLLDLPEPEFGSGVIGVCDLCGTRQAVIVLAKERYKLCVLDFLNKTWIKSEKTPGVPAPAYRSERVWFDSSTLPGGKAPAIVLTPAKVVRHPTVLITPDVYGLTTTVLDGAIRFAREGFEVLLPDVGKTDGIGAGHHLSLRSGARFRGGVSMTTRRVTELVRFYRDALEYLQGREMVDRTKSAVFGTSYGASLALAVAAETTQLTAVALAYPIPIRPADLPKLVTVPVLALAGGKDRTSGRALAELKAACPGATVVTVPGVGHNFLSRDLSAYDLPRAEAAWGQIVAFLRQQLMPPPPRPPAPPVVPAAPAPVAPGLAPPAAGGSSVSARPTRSAPAPG
jgi:dienelactone hydrolase